VIVRLLNNTGGKPSYVDTKPGIHYMLISVISFVHGCTVPVTTKTGSDSEILVATAADEATKSPYFSLP
jgi:hypothetical protein